MGIPTIISLSMDGNPGAFASIWSYSIYTNRKDARYVNNSLKGVLLSRKGGWEPALLIVIGR
jgi:hypothetical protein